MPVASAVSGMQNRGQHALLQWCNSHCSRFGVTVSDFSASFADGRAFAAIVSSCLPALLDYRSLDFTNKWDVFNRSFKV